MHEELLSNKMTTVVEAKKHMMQGRSKWLGWSDFGPTNICARENHAHKINV